MVVKIYAWFAVKTLEFLMFFTRFSVFMNTKIELGHLFTKKFSEKVANVCRILKKVIL